MHAAHEELGELERRWIQGEIEGDAGALAAIVTDDFALIGPAGFVLSREQWLARYRSGDLRTHSLRFEDTMTRIYAAAAVIVGRHVQQAEYRGQVASGEYCATHIAIRDETQWQLAGLHLSPIVDPPALAAPTSDEDAR